MQTNLYPQQWLHLPKDVKEKLINVFEIVRTGASEVRDQEVISDGYTLDDLRSITNEKMNEYVGSQETFLRAWELTLAKVHSELNPPVATIQNVDGEPTAVDIVEPDVVVVPKELEPETQEVLGEEILIVADKPFCDTCASKGVRHLKECPKYVPIIPYLSEYEKK